MLINIRKTLIIKTKLKKLKNKYKSRYLIFDENIFNNCFFYNRLFIQSNDVKKIVNNN